MEIALNTPNYFVGALPQSAGKALKNSYSSVTAGVGNLIPQQTNLERPELSDFTSEEAFEKFKEYNTKTNLRTNERRMWGGLVSQIAGNVMFAAAAGLGVGALGSAPIVVALAVFAGAIGVLITSYYTFQHTSTREQSERYMDVDDYKIKRQAGAIAQEIKKAFEEDRTPPKQNQPQLQEQIEVLEAANDSSAPRIQLAADTVQHEAKLQLFSANQSRV